MKILVTGGSGYKGSVLIPKLIEDGHNIVSVDTNWFGDNLEDHKSLEKIFCDIREIDKIPFEGIEAIIHLANIANDPAVELNPSLSWEVNVLASQQLAERAVREGVKKIIYAASSSSYGIAKEYPTSEKSKISPQYTYALTKYMG